MRGAEFFGTAKLRFASQIPAPERRKTEEYQSVERDFGIIERGE